MASHPMRKVSLRNIAAHKLRLALTVLAVVLGTAFISGAFMFTNSLSNTFDAALNNSFRGVDAVVSASPTSEDRDEILARGDVDKVNVSARTSVVFAKGTDADPEPIQTGAGSASLSIWYPAEDAVGEAAEIVEGTEPHGTEEIILSAPAAEKFDISVGDQLLVVDAEQRHTMKVVGLFEQELDQGLNLSGMMDFDGYKQLYLADDNLNQLLVDASEGTDPDALVSDLEAAFPDLQIDTGEKLAEQLSEQIQSALSFVNYFLVAFGLVALLVGTFLIANTFSMIVAQRTKEFALLRALGASRGQITRSVSLEATIIGLIGSGLGVVAGIGLVAAIKAVMNTQGIGLPDSGLGLSTSAVVVPLVLGTIVTVVSAFAPARRAGQVEPVEAMRSTESSTSQPLLWRTVIGVVLIVIGIVAAIMGVVFEDWTTSQRASLVGVGAFGVIVGYFLAGPAFSLPVVPTFGRLIGWPFGAVGKLASTNTSRNPRRTSTTAFALALGVALVTVIGMLGATMQSSIEDTVESDVASDYILTGPRDGSFPVPAEVADTAAEVDGVKGVITYSVVPVGVDGAYGHQIQPGQGASDVMKGNPLDLIKFDITEGTGDISEGGMIASESFAKDHGWKVGESYELAAPGISPATTQVELKGVFAPNMSFTASIISQASVDEVLPVPVGTPVFVGVLGDGSVDHETLRENLTEAMKSFIVVQVMDGEEMAGLAATMVDQMLNILYALLALAVIIAILGIINTLTLSVIERRQEIGMLRAVGTFRRQIRTMITLESVQIAVFGAVAGVLIGLGLGWAFIDVLAGEGLDQPTIPWSMIVTVLVASVVVGLVAAIFPASRAAKTPPLDAIAD